MTKTKGFTLMELVAIVIIVGILASIAVTNYFNFMLTGAKQAAMNNLMILANMEKTYYLNNDTYCIKSGDNPVCGDNLSDLNASLTLNIPVDNYYTYYCDKNTNPPPAPAVCCFAIANPNSSPILINQNSCGGMCTSNPSSIPPASSIDCGVPFYDNCGTQKGLGTSNNGCTNSKVCVNFTCVCVPACDAASNHPCSLNTYSDHCGDVCGTGTMCASGVCNNGCCDTGCAVPIAQTMCNHPANDNCGHLCGPGTFCGSGSCINGCCNTGCPDPSTEPCGTSYTDNCNNPCPTTGTMCASGNTCVNNECTCDTCNCPGTTCPCVGTTCPS